MFKQEFGYIEKYFLVHYVGSGVMKDNIVVAMAMSGGVDSSAATLRLLDAGYKVFGITAGMTKEYSRCCADIDIVRAAEMCDKLGIPHHIVDLSEDFGSYVIDDFMDEYISGKTPSPCVKCNQYIKFGALADAAKQLGADKIATGHYARIMHDNKKIYLCRGKDRRKDQSYFLARLTKEQLDFSLFPLGDMLKPDVVKYAEEHKLSARKSRESQELCFVTEGTHGDYIDLRSFKTGGTGEIVTVDGKKVGEHHGIHHYTIGQRKGLGIAMGYPVYVTGIDKENNRIIIGERSEVMFKEMNVSGMMATGSDEELPDTFSADCQIRYQHKPAECVVVKQSDGNYHVQFSQSQFAVTPGQLAVFYNGDKVFSSGWISHLS